MKDFTLGLGLGALIVGSAALFDAWMRQPTDDTALAAETKLEACEIEIGIMEKLLAAKMDSLAECAAILKNALMDCGAQAEAKARRIHQSTQGSPAVVAGGDVVIEEK
jgi:hypothetical protein